MSEESRAEKWLFDQPLSKKKEPMAVRIETVVDSHEEHGHVLEGLGTVFHAIEIVRKSWWIGAIITGIGWLWLKGYFGGLP